MAEYTGGNLYCTWLSGGGTVVLSGDYRTMESTKSIGLVQATAGSDANHSYLTTVKDGKYTWAGVAQAAGTVLETALLAGTSGTLIVAREGTATGKTKETCVCISLGAQYRYPYDNVVEITCEFQANAAATTSVY